MCIRDRRKVSAAADSDAAAAFLDMLVHVIDFRSRHTVTHTVTTAWTAYELSLIHISILP